MRHGKKDNHLGRTTAHRAALLSNLASSLILNKRIETTLAKAKELRKFVEPIITRSKEDTTHARRTVFSYLQNKEAIKELFGIIAEKVAERPGGYTRIIKLGTRLGDNAEVCLMELVDFNESLLAAANADEKKKTRRGRRRGGKGTTTTVAALVATEETAAAVETPAEAPSEETTNNEAEKSEE